MASVQRGPAAGLAAQVVLLLALGGTLGIGATGWLLGLTYGLVTAVALARGLAVHSMTGLGAANRVTLTRAVLVGGVTALAAGAGDGSSAAVLLLLAAVALALDGIDGWVARRTLTVSALGGRFDMEVDAFLILVLSVLVARWAGAWVLLIGAARYLFVLAGRLWPWMRRTLPARPWRKVVAATQGIVLAAEVVPRGPRWVLVMALTVAWALLAESFGRDIWWLWVRREADPRGEEHPEAVSAAMASNDA